MKKVVVERFSSYIELTVNKVCILLVGGLVWKMITNKLFCTKGTFSLETECGWCCWCWYSLKGGNSRVVVVGKSGIFKTVFGNNTFCVCVFSWEVGF